MVIVDISNTAKQAFVFGFYKGISAPVMLFGKFQSPALPEIKPVIYVHTNEEQALNNDWLAIGADFNNAIVKHGPKSTAKNSAA